MKKNLFTFYFAVLVLAGCSKKSSPDSGGTPVVTTPPISSSATVDAGVLQQSIRGFGGANIVAWTGDLTSAQRDLAFSPSTGIGLSVLRVRIPNSPADFAAEKPTIDAAKAYGASVIATAWSAPANMKDNGNVIGGKLLPSAYANYAAYLSSYNTAVGGVLAISPSNEPNIQVTYESMNLTASDLAAFAAANGTDCGAPLMGPEPFNMSQTFINDYLSNAAANTKTSFICGHIYGATPVAFSPGKEIWMTEHFTDTNDANGWAGALTVGKEIHDCMSAGYNMYVWWYIRRSYGFIDENGNITKRGYVIAQWARWIRPGATKITCTANPVTGVYITAYKSGTHVVLVIINQNTTALSQSFTLNGVTVTGFDRYATTATANLVADSFAASGSSVTGVTIAPLSVTTLVSK